jgi:protease IV
MLRLAARSGAFMLLFLLSGCAFVNIPLFHGPAPYEERVIEGQGRAKLLLIDIAGVISEKGQSGALQESPSLVADVKEALQKAEEDEDVAGVILRINSPGGTVTASDIIHHELLAFKGRRKVPLHACITGVGASGGYYVATAADEISAHPTAVTGSIGVLLMRFNIAGLLGKIGVSELTVKSGDKKDFMSPFRAVTPEEEKLMQAIIDALHRRFVEIIAARPGNTLSRQELEVLADGRIFTAEQAVAARLIDRVGYLDEAVANLKKKLKLEKARVVSYYRPGGYQGTIYSSLHGQPSPTFNLINVNGDGLGFFAGTEFMYLWEP